MTFRADNVYAGSARLSDGVASLSISTLTQGVHTVSAGYGGDASYTPAAANSITETVTYGTIAIGNSSSNAITVNFASAEKPASIAVLTGGAANLDFTNAGGGTCKVNRTYAAGASCTVIVLFKPQYAGVRTGAVVLANASNQVIATAYLQGIGEGPQPVFSPAT